MSDLDEDWDNFLHDNTSKKLENIEYNNKKAIFTDLYISTKTKICYLNTEININETFWKIDIMDYNNFSEGIIKKQIKLSCLDVDEVNILDKKIENEKNIINVVVISSINNPQGRIKFKDVRKISIGICKKDLINTRTKEKSAFYNCFVLVIRLLFDGIFKEIHVKVFNTGKLEIPGIQSDYMLYKVLDYLKKILSAFYENIDYNNKSETVLINSNFSCGYYLDREKLFNQLRYKYNINSCYDPCSYPGIQSHFYIDNKYDIDEQNGLQKNDQEQTKISYMIFRTGSILIVGKCEDNVIYYIYNFIKKIIENEFDLISKEKNNNKKVINLKKKKKRILCFYN